MNHGFDKNGTISRKKQENPTKKTPEKVEVRNFLDENSSASIRKSARQFDVSPTTYRRIVRKQLNMRFYLHKGVQPLTEAHKEQRMRFCEWLLNQDNPEAFVVKVIWTDEKYFCLNQRPHW